MKEGGNKDLIFIGKTLVNNIQMTEVSRSSPSRSTWDYSWTISTTLRTVSITVARVDSSNNSYSGTDSLTFNVDNVAPFSENSKLDEDTSSQNDKNTENSLKILIKI